MKTLMLIILMVCAVLVVAILGLGGLAVYMGHRQTALLSRPPEHGTSFIIEADLSQIHGDTNALANLNEALRDRFLKFGVRIFLEPVSESRIRIMAPITNAMDAAAAGNFLSRGGILEFRLVHPDSDALIGQGEVPPGYEVLKHAETQPDGQQRLETVVVKKEPENGLAGNIIKHAMVVRGNLGEPQIYFTLNPESTLAFAKVTRENIGRRLAIVLDGQLYSAPVIQSPIESGAGQITGHFDSKEAWMLANTLNSPLPVPIVVLQSETF